MIRTTSSKVYIHSKSTENKWTFFSPEHLRTFQFIMQCRKRSGGGKEKNSHLATSNKPPLFTKKKKNNRKPQHNKTMSPAGNCSS